MRIKASRSIVAVIAVYAIGLQALLSGWIVGVHAAEASLGVICTHDGNPAQHPAPDDSCLCGPACAMAAHALAFGVGPATAVTLAWQPGRGEAIAANEPAPASNPDPAAGGHCPRAPPQA